jgi:hypothetical protein
MASEGSLLGKKGGHFRIDKHLGRRLSGFQTPLSVNS